MTEEKPKRVMVSVATYGGQIYAGLMMAMIQATNKANMIVGTHQSSAACHGFNQCWQMALNGRKTQGVDYFLLIHADVEPEAYFIDKMLDLMDKHKAELLSVVLPIKSSDGLTSTAIDEPPPGGFDGRWFVRRYTMKELFEMPPTFGHDKLLVNNGLMMVDMRAPWVDEVEFKTETEIRNYHGFRDAVTFSEDWYFSREANKRGAKIFATREVIAGHRGITTFPNDHAWGSRETDAPAYEVFGLPPHIKATPAS